MMYGNNVHVRATYLVHLIFIWPGEISKWFAGYFAHPKKTRNDNPFEIIEKNKQNIKEKR
jgi:hypothetical protein